MPSEEPGARCGEALHLLAWSADVRRNPVRRGEAGPAGVGGRRRGMRGGSGWVGSGRLRSCRSNCSPASLRLGGRGCGPV